MSNLRALLGRLFARWPWGAAAAGSASPSSPAAVAAAGVQPAPSPPAHLTAPAPPRAPVVVLPSAPSAGFAAVAIGRAATVATAPVSVFLGRSTPLSSVLAGIVRPPPLVAPSPAATAVVRPQVAVPGTRPAALQRKVDIGNGMMIGV